MTTPVLLDVDTGTDDALALLYAVAHPDLKLLGVSCVAGNAGLDQVLFNTAKVLDAAGAPEIPIAGGPPGPPPSRRAPGGAHGADGLAGIKLPDPRRAAAPNGAVQMLRSAIERSPEPVTLVALGPQTNLALLLSLYPEVVDGLARVVFMGGSAGPGTAGAPAEFNIGQEPEAAAYVLGSGLPTTMYGIDVFERLTVDAECVDHFRRAQHPALRLAGDLLHRRSRSVGDAGALVALTDPQLFVIRRRPVRVVLAGPTRGQTIVGGRLNADDAEPGPGHGWSELDVVEDLDGAAASSTFVRTIERYG